MGSQRLSRHLAVTPIMQDNTMAPTVDKSAIKLNFLTSCKHYFTMAMQVIAQLANEEEIPARDLRRQRIFRERGNPFDIPDADFQERYRLTRGKFRELLEMVQEDLQHPTNRNVSLSPALQLVVALRFYACGHW